MRITITLPTPPTATARSLLPEQTEAARGAIAAAYGVPVEKVEISLHKLASLAKPASSAIRDYIVLKADEHNRQIGLTRLAIANEIGVHDQMLERWERHGYTELDHERYPGAILKLEQLLKEQDETR